MEYYLLVRWYARDGAMKCTAATQATILEHFMNAYEAHKLDVLPLRQLIAYKSPRPGELIPVWTLDKLPPKGG